MNEEIWKGEFGDEYTDRNEKVNDTDIRSDFWYEVLRNCDNPWDKPGTLLEVGANIGRNLSTISLSFPDVHLAGLEPNESARNKLQNTADEIVEGTATDIQLPDESKDLVFTCGVLIHIPPEELLKACSEIYRVSKNWIVTVEYYSRHLQEIPYHGRDNMLWKRDYGRYWLKHFPSLEPIACGFAWKPLTGLDDLTWWIFRK